jgi:hypothetical protein
VSDCSLIRSTTAVAGVKVWTEPVAGVRTILPIETLKEKIEGFAGRVSATRVKLTVAVPLPPQLTVHFLAPLQAGRDKTASNRKGNKERVLLRFMWPPRQNSMRLRSLEGKTRTSPTVECNAKGERKGIAKAADVPNS